MAGRLRGADEEEEDAVQSTSNKATSLEGYFVGLAGPAQTAITVSVLFVSGWADLRFGP